MMSTFTLLPVVKVEDVTLMYVMVSYMRNMIADYATTAFLVDF